MPVVLIDLCYELRDVVYASTSNPSSVDYRKHSSLLFSTRRLYYFADSVSLGCQLQAYTGRLVNNVAEFREKYAVEC